MSSFASNMRKIWLGVTIVSDIAMLVCWWFVNPFFFHCFVGINVVVIIWELISVLKTGHTLSTNTTNTLEAGGSKSLIGYLAIIFMLSAMGALALHLGWI